MFKRFTIGFILGIGLMYWYINDSEEMVASWSTWMNESAANYRGDKTHEAVDHQTR